MEPYDDSLPCKQGRGVGIEFRLVGQHVLSKFSKIQEKTIFYMYVQLSYKFKICFLKRFLIKKK